MQDDSTRILMTVSRLLDYPDAAWRQDLPGLRQAAADLAPAPSRAALLVFIDEAAAMGPLACQERYTANFDLAPSSSLDVTYHAYGDTEDRLRALQGLQETYAAAGYERTGGELPDFLPLVLEFLAVASSSEQEAVIRWTGPGLAALHGRLRDQNSPFAALTQQLVHLFDLPRASEDAAGHRKGRPAPAVRRPMEKTP